MKYLGEKDVSTMSLVQSYRPFPPQKLMIT